VVVVVAGTLMCRSVEPDANISSQIITTNMPTALMDYYRPDVLSTARCRQRSADTTTLLVSPTQRVTFGDRAFPVAAARAWNSLPPQIRAASSLSSFSAADKGPSVSPVI